MPWNTTSDPLQFTQAADWFLGRVPITKGTYEQMGLKWRRYAFTAAGIAQLDMVHQLWTETEEAIRKGEHLREYKKRVTTMLTNEWAGSVKRPSFRIETIYRNAIQHAYGRGRWEQQTDPDVMLARPFGLFDAIIDGDQTQICEDRDGIVLPIDHPWWDANYPPLHHRCRSGRRTLTRGQANKRGITEDPTALETDAQRGFGFAPTKHEWAPDPNDYPVNLYKAFQAKQAHMGAKKPVMTKGKPKPKASTKVKAPKVTSKPKSAPVVQPEAAQVHRPPDPRPLHETILHQKIGDAKGSNPGGLYRGADGVERYVKFYDDPAQAHGEHLANLIYKELGQEAPDSIAFVLPDGRTGYASNIISGGRTLSQAGLTEARAKAILDGFAGDVLTGNWDAIGASLDNILVLGTKRVARIDQGGTFLMRARYGRKPTALLDQITEWDKLADASINPSYARVFAEAGISSPLELGKRLTKQIDDILALEQRSGGWAAFVNSHAHELAAADRKAIIRMLTARTRLLEAKKAEIDAYLKASRRAKKAIKGTDYKLEWSHQPVQAFNQKITGWGKRGGSGEMSTLYSKTYGNHTVEATGRQVVNSWIRGGHTSIFQSDLRADVEAIRNGRKFPGRSGIPEANLRRLIETRRERWERLSAETGIPVPKHFNAYRGVSGDEFLQDVYEAWKAEAGTMTMRTKSMASWSMDPSNSFTKNQVVYNADLPLEETFADQFLDDAGFITTYLSEHEVITMHDGDNAFSVDPRRVVVKVGGRTFTWNDRAEFIAGWEQRHGPGGKRR